MLLFEFNRLVSTARIVTPGIGTLLLSSTTPEMVVLAGSPGARPDAVKLAGNELFPGKVAWMRLLALPSWKPKVRVAAARPSESVLTVKLGWPAKLPPPSLTVKVTGTPPSRLFPVSTTTAINGLGSG